jgi:hypothetical protein
LSHDARRFARLHYGDDLIGLGSLEVGLDEFIAASLRRLQDRDVALLRPSLQPLLKAIGDPTERLPAHRVEPAVGVEEADHPFRLLKRLDQSV